MEVRWNYLQLGKHTQQKVHSHVATTYKMKYIIAILTKNKPWCIAGGNEAMDQ